MAAEASLSSKAAEREAALNMLDRVAKRSANLGKKITLGADTLNQEKVFMRDCGIASGAAHPRICEGQPGEEPLNEERTDDKRRSISQRKRKLIERVFGWNRADGLLRQVSCVAYARGLVYRLTIVACNLMRMRRLVRFKPRPSKPDVCLDSRQSR